MTVLEVVADSTEDALVSVQEMHDGAMTRFAEMYQDWFRISRETLGQSLPWPSAEDVPQAA